MDNRFQDSGALENTINYAPTPTPGPKAGYRERRRLEMKRRFSVLQSRRSHLERELEAIKVALLSLDHQMQSYAAYEQFSNLG